MMMNTRKLKLVVGFVGLFLLVVEYHYHPQIFYFSWRGVLWMFTVIPAMIITQLLAMLGYYFINKEEIKNEVLKGCTEKTPRAPHVLFWSRLFVYAEDAVFVFPAIILGGYWIILIAVLFGITHLKTMPTCTSIGKMVYIPIATMVAAQYGFISIMVFHIIYDLWCVALLRIASKSMPKDCKVKRTGNDSFDVTFK